MTLTYHEGYVTLMTHSYSRAWVASLKPPTPDSRYRFDREHYLRALDVTSAKSNKYRDYEIDIPLIAGEQYEYGNVDATSGGGVSGFWRVEDERLVEITRHDILFGGAT